MKKFILIIFFFFASTFLSHSEVVAETNTELQAKIEETRIERDKLLEQQKKLLEALNELSKEGQTLQVNVRTLDATRTKLANDLKLTQANINSSNLTIKKLENGIGENITEIETHRSAIKESLKKLASYDKQNVVFDILAYKSLEEVWSDAVDLSDLQTKLTERIRLLERTQLKLIENKVAKESQKIMLVSLSSELKGQKKVIDETRSAQAFLLAATKNREIEYQKILAENRARQLEFERQLFLFETQLKSADISERPTVGRGVLSWPLDKVYITQQFGKTSVSGRLYSSGTHNGTDFRALVGDKVKTVRAGVVSGTGNTDDQRGCYSYGKWILIKHDNGLSTLYAHLSGSIVVVGQEVNDGQVIGYAGGQPGQYGSGFSTGPHLHLGVFTSAGIQILPYSTSLNCKNVSIPLANPADYLDPMAYLPLL